MAQSTNESSKPRRGSFLRTKALREFELTYEMHKKVVKQYLNRVIPDVHNVDDLFQETFLRAFRYGASFDKTKGSQAAWILRIARNVVIDYFKSKGRIEVAVPSEELEQVSETGEEPVDTEWIAAAIRRLSPEERDMVIMRRIKKMPVDKVAEQLGISRRTANRRLASGLLNLRQILAEVRV